MAWLERYLIKRAKLGLFHGKETFDTYAPYCRQPMIVHNIHISRAEHIPDDQLRTKIAKVAEGPLKIGYVGRANPMKGPLDWIAALDGFAASGVAFDAFWMGEGEDMEAMAAEIAERGLEDKIRLLGFVKDRAAVLEKFRDAQIFMFTHKTPESPRCLIEALISGTPIVGYDGAFARDLISGHGGGALVPLNDVEALTQELVALGRDRGWLAKLIAAAKQDGTPYDDVSVFEHRSEIIKTHL
jgi:glycosyltransferase involved in cell wall biosynthesis